MLTSQRTIRLQCLLSFLNFLAFLSFYLEKEKGPSNPVGFGAPGELRGLACDLPGATGSKMLWITCGVG